GTSTPAPSARSSRLDPSTLDRERNLKRLDRLPHVVRADHRRTTLERDDGRADRCCDGPRGCAWLAGALPESSLPGDADEHGAPERTQLLEPTQELEVLVRRLPEPDAGVDGD